MCATPVLGLLLGPEVLAAPAAIVLLLQALFFAHGGLTTIGANIFTLGVVGPWSAWLLARGLRRLGLSMIWVVGLSCGLADAIVYVIDAGILATAVAPAGEAKHVFVTVLLALLVPQGVLAILEGVVSAGLMASLLARRPTLLPTWLASARGRAAVAAALLLLVLGSGGTAAAGELPGLDEAVFETTASSVGHPPRAPFVDLGGAELSALLMTFFAMGLVTGQAWERISGRIASEEPEREVS
jgi:cobalt/nickel transport system permease protein